MDFFQQVAKDLAQITSTDFATSIVFTSPSSVVKMVAGYAGKHALTVTDYGFISVNTKKAHVSVSEVNMLAAGMVTRDGNGDILTFKDYLVSWTDQSGQNKTYKIQADGGRTDENNGIITFILGYYQPQ